MKLNPVRAIMDLFPNGLACGPRIVHRLVISRQANLRRPLDSFAGGDQPHGGNLHPGTLEIAEIDGPLDVDVSVTSSVTHQITERRESRTKILLRIGERQKGAVLASIINGAGKRRPTWLDPIKTKPKHMCVSINQARQNC